MPLDLHNGQFWAYLGRTLDSYKLKMVDVFQNCHWDNIAGHVIYTYKNVEWC